MDGSPKYKLNWNDLRHVALHTAMVAVAAFFVLLPADGGDSLVALLGTLKVAVVFALQSSARQWMRDNSVEEPGGAGAQGAPGVPGALGDESRPIQKIQPAPSPALPLDDPDNHQSVIAPSPYRQ